MKNFLSILFFTKDEGVIQKSEEGLHAPFYPTKPQWTFVIQKSEEGLYAPFYLTEPWW